MPEQNTLEDSALTKAYRQQVLWPSIYTAVDVYIKRRARNADAYELIWRLIHIWECTAITLAAAAAARLRGFREQEEQYRAIRELCFGIIRDDRGETGKVALGRRPQSAFGGSIDAWIDVLGHVASKVEAHGSEYLAALRKFLGEEGIANSRKERDETRQGIDLGPLIQAWSLACDVPKDITRLKEVNVRDAFKAVNSFRNRFAHVPFPYDQIAEIHKRFEQCTTELFEVQPKATDGTSSLRGCIAFDRHLLQGSVCHRNGFPDATAEVQFLFNVNVKQKKAAESWLASPFLYVDQMMRPYLLARFTIPGDSWEDGTWEYVRYLAESNAVLTLPEQNQKMLAVFLSPTEREYKSSDEGDQTASQEAKIPSDLVSIPTTAPNITEVANIQTFPDAVDAIRIRKFSPAIEFIETFLETRPEYHVGWLWLGNAKRELAVDLTTQNGDTPKAEQLFNDSLVALQRAAQHRDPWYRAEAHYHASKTYTRIWQHRKDATSRENALNEAMEAVKLYSDPKFQSWYEHVMDLSSTLTQ